MPEGLVQVVDVALDSRSGGRDAVYTYQAPPDVAPGDALFVPLGSRSVMGYAITVREIGQEDLGFPIKNLRPVHSRVEGLSLPEPLLELVRMISQEYLCPLPVALTVAAPPGVKDRLVQAWTLSDEPHEHKLTVLQEEVLATLRDAGGVLTSPKGKKLPASSEKALKLLRGKGLVRQSLAIAPFSEQRKPHSLLRLTHDEQRLERFLREEGKRKPAQALTIMRLQTAEDAALTAQEIKAMSGVTDTIVRSLVEAKLLERVEQAALLKPAPKPNAYQQLAIDSVTASIREGLFTPFLLFGVTGSGKTEVYLHASSEALKLGRQVLYVVPEIALATQAVSQLRERFGGTVALLHSELPAKERLENWSRIRSGDAPVVLGARSALFAPLDNLGLIVLDEEHEAAYKQESAPRYHAKKVARFLGERHSCPVILGSATPSVESFFEAEQGRLTLLSLPERAAQARLPAVHVEDLRQGYKAHRPSILTDELHRRMEESFGRGEQAILFLNRRAYAPFLICRDCGHQFKCPNCAVSLSYSRRDRRLRCHHCGHSSQPPETCPNCRGQKLNPFGVGTEKVEEAVREAFPEARVARLDRDVAQRKGALEETLAQVRSGEIQCLVGTQIVAKGLDFPNVTLVGVIAADISLNLPDFRSSERTFQLLSQVAGRAGRGMSPGHVV
ncbi:MAG TPA: primosomal protein N', partial [Fimbriimonadaceae bacterium]|nr:primosomal protein N' [Fimbriimonadaceae bacterium]